MRRLGKNILHQRKTEVSVLRDDQEDILYSNPDERSLKSVPVQVYDRALCPAGPVQFLFSTLDLSYITCTFVLGIADLVPSVPGIVLPILTFMSEGASQETTDEYSIPMSMYVNHVALAGSTVELHWKDFRVVC